MDWLTELGRSRRRVAFLGLAAGRARELRSLRPVDLAGDETVVTARSGVARERIRLPCARLRSAARQSTLVRQGIANRRLQLVRQSREARRMVRGGGVVGVSLFAVARLGRAAASRVMLSSELRTIARL